MNKVLFILHLPPPVHGSSVMGKAIKDSKCINSTFKCNYINLTTSFFLDEIGKNFLLKIGRYLTIVVTVVKQLILNKPDICYFAITAKGIAFFRDAFIVFIVKFFGVPIVFHFHNKGVKTKQHKAIDNLIYKLVFKNLKIQLVNATLQTK